MLLIGQVMQLALVLQLRSAIQEVPDRVYPKTHEVHENALVAEQVLHGLMQSNWQMKS